MELKLFLRKSQINSTFIFSLMNYNKVDFSLFVESSFCGFKLIKNEIPDAKTLPILQKVTKTNKLTIESQEEILKFLITQKLIKKGISYSAWEQQSYEYLTTKMFEVSNGISRGFYKRLQQSIKVLPKGTTAETVGTIIESVKDASKMAWLEYKTNQKKVKIKIKWTFFSKEINFCFY